MERESKTRHIVNSFGNRGLLSFVLIFIACYTISYLDVVPVVRQKWHRAVTIPGQFVRLLLLKILSKLSSPILHGNRCVWSPPWC